MASSRFDIKYENKHKLINAELLAGRDGDITFILPNLEHLCVWRAVKQKQNYKASPLPQCKRAK